jgi:methionyl-tRNA formyltransferase
MMLRCAHRRFTTSAAVASAAPPYRVVFFGTDEISVHTLTALHQQHSSGLIGALELVCPADRPLRSKKVPCPTKLYAMQHGLVTHTVDRQVDFRMNGWVAPFEGPTWDLGVVASFGYFLPPRLIRSFRHGMINMHPSLLPLYVHVCPCLCVCVRFCVCVCVCLCVCVCCRGPS